MYPHTCVSKHRARDRQIILKNWFKPGDWKDVSIGSDKVKICRAGWQAGVPKEEEVL